MCKIIMFLVISLVGLIGVSVGQIIQDGQCDDNIQLQSNFNTQQFLGTWYENAVADHPLAGDCSTIEFTAVNDDVSVYHKTVRANFFQDYNGTATVANGTAKLTLNLPTISTSPLDFWIMLTDYSNFALAYRCENVGTTQRQIIVWQLSRATTYPSEMIPALMNTTMINVLGINSNNLRPISHGDQACYVLPIIQAGQPVILPGQCDTNIPVAQNFSAGRFLGVWHQVYSYYSESSLGSCNRAQYSSQDGVVVDVVNSEIINQTLRTIEGNATVASTDNSGRLRVILEVLPNVFIESELLILGSDYDNWAVSYTCNNLENNQRRVFSWIVSRTRQLTAAAQTQVDALVNSILDLNYAYYQPTNQSDTDCFYIPEPVPNQPAVFGGQCDMTVPVQQNFIAANYLGLWHQIESYPTPFQFGTCANAFYSLGQVAVDVFNTQVVNQTLDTITGVASPLGTEGKLIVSFPVAGTNVTTSTDYWIITTDYTSYALVYSCTNINEYQQQITLWKLSRTKALTAAANAAINSALATQTFFDQRFFEVMDQSREGCFYYPEPVQGQQVVFPGQCADDNIPVVENFNLTLFAGQWYETDAYPKDPQPGQCIDHQFTVSGNTGYTLVSNNVDDQLLGISNSQLTFINGTSARFNLITFTNGTASVSFPYYIVDTDYNNYALAYSCVDIDSDFRGIFSWKLSRTKQLSAAASASINTAMENIVTLSNDYFEPIDQSDNACFYFPDLAPGEPVILPGQCDNDTVIPVMRNFNAAAYLGRWRMIESYPSSNQFGACNQATYTLNNDSSINVYNTEVQNQILSEINGVGRLVESTGNETFGKILVTFPNSTQPFELWVLDTDYVNYSLVYGCVNINNQQREVWSWKLSRTTNLTAQSVTAINQVLSNINVLNDRYYQTVDHSDAACFYYPDLNPGSTVIFRGQCNQSIPVVTSFDAVGYMGLWHDIQRYPAPFQDGTCGNAFYTLLEGPVVDVFNTQVLNETLDTITGSAVLDLADANDTSAKLLVTFPVGGFNLTTPYWVLSTDYTSYALVYSCSNIDDEYRSVTSWKLSRTKSLTTAANNAMNAVINTIDVLDDRYYVTQNQTREGCFYFPEPVPGQQVVFPGQCADDSIPVVENFNLTQFAGQWYETEAYPKDPQPGQCIDHQFTVAVDNSGYILISNNVEDQLLGTSNSQLTFINGTSARFNLTVFTNGTDSVSFPYYIVDTDYNSYALAYSCVDINNDFKGVFSWKLSRTRQLSTAAGASINSTIANIVTLSNDYFEPIDQSDDACFYFPDLAPGEPVIMPGQCDNDTVIPVIRNFNATAYLGRWRMIQSYPSANQVGACNQATYTLNSDGSINVYNTEVQNQIFREITGVGRLVESTGNETLGKILVTFPNSAQPFELWVLDTDYVNYSLVYGCVNINNQQRQVWSWKLSRTTNLTAQSVTAINQVLSNINVLNDRYYQAIDHSDAACFYYPDLNPGSTVIFRGQCNESIPVVTSFDAVGYMGLWHDIQRYPAPFQDGTCGNAFYTLLEGPVVDVFNTQVLNETLDTITGSAVLDLADANDTSAKLLVTFPVGGFNLTTPYWVLSTDYTSYALVYSCSNIDDEYRSVTSWKLSRTKSLTTAANNAMNAVINTIDVLDDRYYVTQNQTREGCFYFPEPVPGQQVVFPGQCADENIPVVENFNLSQFAGQWYETEAYPKDPQPGQCIDHQFTVAVDNSGYILISNNVEDQLLGTSNSQLTFINGTSARFNLTVFTNGTDSVSFPYYIVDTDYNSYALAYSCVDINNDFKGVFSWKLSRTRQLSATAGASINSTIANIVTLSNDYYEPIDQSDDACFYFPDLAPGEPVIMPGQCDNDTVVPVIRNFNASAYLGRWRMIESYPSSNQFGACNQATYSLNSDGSINVYNTEVQNQIFREINGVGRLVESTGNETLGKILVTFPNSIQPFELWVLDTDYVNYSLVYGCVNINNQQRQVWSWKLSRTTNLTAQSVTAINQVISNINVLNDRYYQTIDHSDAACFYYPDLNPDSTVIFRGQCNESIPVVTNFNAVGYMGLWHDIQRYPAPFQNGTCGNAFYTLLDGPVVDVFNTQVFNQTLDTITGSAVLDLVDANDTSAKLLVTFPVGGFNLTTPYWVLSTDYTSYALVYSCSNIDDEYRSVTSWKLSRTKSLTTAANTAMNAVINTIDVLDDRYYITQDQSPEGCFYFPEPEPGVPVLFPGTCDANLTVVQNFNLTAFQGVWHEIEAYPKEDQPGQCISHEFTANADNTLNFRSLNVVDESQGVTEGSVRFTSTDNSARLELSFVSNGTTITIPYWIVDTDYENYAVAYSCVQQNADFRGVWSWKLSRTKSLNPNSNVAINNAIANIDVLDNIYYEPISQSDQSCFYYPVLGPSEPVIFPGQCNTNISAISNFDTNRYLGTWRLIESYYTDNQQGACNEATYSAGNGTVIVFNTQVINEELRTITGSAVVASTDGSGKLLVTFPSSNSSMELWVLDTDYDNYSLVYSCENINSDQRRVFSWKLSRTNSLSEASVSAINATMNSIDVLDQRYYNQVNRTDAACFYFPVPDGSAVIFRGQCDQSINVLTGFDATRYMGTWNYIESYPAPFTAGTCGTADYTLQSADMFSIETTQVVRQELVLQNGTAVRDTGDTSAKFRVTFEVNGRNLTSDYWVLSTDYDNYALVYSCENLNEETRRVIAIKLSRALNLTVASQTAITNAINQVQVLDQQYFEDVGQSEDDCFFYPDNFGGDVLLDGQCVPDSQVPVVTNFNSTAFTGTWHEIARFPSDLQVGECSNKELSFGAQNTVNITQTEVSNEFQTVNVIPGSLATDGRGVITAQIAGVPFNTFYILDTDYTEYALIYGCRNIDNATKQIYSWKLSRSRFGLSDAANNRTDEVVSNNVDLFENYYSYTNQSNDACFHYPEFYELPSAIELFGPCDENVRGVPNFNLDAYLGRWMEIGRYPQPTQQGTCNRAYYTAGSDFSILNVEVRNQSRAQLAANAVVVSNDGTGVINVTIVRGGEAVTSTLHVLATDYTSYALVYSCRNLENGNRRLGSWKFSRTPTLTPQAETIIDSVINQTQGLAQQYYQATSQSEEDCFYVPSVNVNAAPLFRGQCSANVEGVTGFNAERFAGWWHEIERYPVDNNRGECISSQYQGSGSSYQVVDTVVANGTAQINSGTVQVSATGRLTRTISGQVQDIWVLATDYDNYALLYSCEQVDDEYIRVWSAKHSKARALTAAAQAAMAPVIEANSLLHSQFYQQVNQSDAACFHYPAVSGQQVILPGQCDDNIPVQQNFDVTAYGGTWYQMERYPQIHEDGPSTCIGARYTLNEATGVVTVLNWEVINGELSTILGNATISSNDGSAKLSVVLPVVGSPTNATVTTSLYVLTTNYESYSLAYSCYNVNSFQRSIGAWKLSRERTMSVGDNQIITSYMASREELHQPYFIEVAHDEDCPEPSSGTFLRSSIIVMMICALWQILS